MVAAGDGTERVASADAVGHFPLAVASRLLVDVGGAALHLCLTHVVASKVLLLIGGKVDRCLSRQHDHLRLLVAGDDPLLVHRIEQLDGVERDAGDLRQLSRRAAAGEVDSVRRDRYVDRRGAYVVLPVVLHAIEGGDEEGDVGPSLAWEIGKDLPEVLLPSGAANRLIDIAGATVVGRYGEHPVPVEGVHVLEVLAHSAGGLAGVHTLVDDRIDRETVDLTGAEHKLPESCRPHPRDGGGIECTLDDSEVLQLQR